MDQANPQITTQSDKTKPAITLDIDLLCRLIESCRDPSLIASLMPLCKTACNYGGRYVLAGGVHLDSDESTLSFIRFIQARPFPLGIPGTGEATPRYSHLESLRFEDWEPSPSVARELAELIQAYGSAGNFSNLAKLCFENGDDFLSADERLPHAFATLSGLTKLKINGCGPTSCTLVRALRAPLQSATLLFPPRTEEELELDIESEDRNPIVLLAACTDTLLALTAEHCETFEEAFDDYRYPQTYPHVRTLALSGASEPTVSPYIHAFPALESLALASEEGHADAPPHLLQYQRDGYRQHRERNRAAQVAHGTWQHLIAFTGGMLDLYLLGLTCPVPVLLLNEIKHGIGYMLPELVAETRPANLTLETMGCENVFAPGGALALALQVPECATITTLRITIDLRSEYEDNVDLRIVLDNMLGCFGRLTSLRRFTLEINGSFDSHRRCMGEDSFLAVERSQANLIPALASRLPTVERGHLTFNHDRTNQTTKSRFGTAY